MDTVDFTWTIEECLKESALLPCDSYAIGESGPRVDLTYWYVACDVVDGDRTISGPAVSQHLSSREKAEEALKEMEKHYQDAYLVEATAFFNRLRQRDGERMKAVVNGIG